MGEQTFLKNKWFIAGTIGIVLLLLLLLVVLSASKKTGGSKQEMQFSESTGESSNRVTPYSQSSPGSSTQGNSQDSANQAQIDAQMRADRGFTDWETKTKTAYPWINRIPIRTDKYFVYFDLDQKIFIGYLYPSAGDDTNVLKAEAQRQLREVKGIPIESFKFTWIVNRK